MSATEHSNDGATGSSASTSTHTHPNAPRPDAWRIVRDELRERGLRWTPQRRTLLEVLSQTEGHVTGAELVERCRERDSTTTPSTVYRTLDVLEELGVIRHHHGADGREEFHVFPVGEHGHLHCRICGGTWELDPADAQALAEALDRSRGFEIDISHVTVVGRCADCRRVSGKVRSTGS
jgi:Fur family transcriptional regulator, ferric uptake regulator